MERGGRQETTAALAEAQDLLRVAKTELVRGALAALVQKLEADGKSGGVAEGPASATTPPPAPKPAAASSGPPAPAAVVSSAASGPPSFSGQKFVPIVDLAWDQGGYGSATLTIYIDLPGVGGIPADRITCQFTKHGIDLTVLDLDGKNYRYVNANLEKDIVVESSKMIVKANKIVLKLVKVKGQYSYDNWQQLTAKKPRDEQEEKNKSKDPSSSIMDMMKNLYDEGDENMKKIIGEAMEKSQRGEKMSPGPAGGDGLDL